MSMFMAAFKKASSKPKPKLAVAIKIKPKVNDDDADGDGKPDIQDDAAESTTEPRDEMADAESPAHDEGDDAQAPDEDAEGQDDQGDDGLNDGERAAAGAAMVSMKHGDKAGFAMALKQFVQACGDYDEDEDKPEGSGM